MICRNENDLGDFQTPSEFTDKICKYLNNRKISPEILLEPTCGEGNFVISALKYFPSLKYIYCVDVQPKYEELFKMNLNNFSLNNDINCEIEFHQDNIFTHKYSTSFMKILKEHKNQFLIIGNPPWITNTELSKISSWNLPKKFNIKKISGLEAITGSANFDIAEYIILALIKQFSFREGIIAMLAKTVVSKNIVRDMPKLDLNISNIKSFVIDSKKEFNVSADSSLFFANFGDRHEEFSSVYSFYKPNIEIKKFGWSNQKFVSNIDGYKHYNYLDGESPFEWRQGVKHDATKIFVLHVKGDNSLLNGYNEIVDIEEDLLYPFVKGSEIRDLITNDVNKKIIISQRSPNQDTAYIKVDYPNTWRYLKHYQKELNSRKSKIYNGKHRFSIFGIGEYSFKPYKIGIAGFYKQPVFTLLLPINNKPVILDDTSYQLGFNNLNEAFFTWILLNMDIVKRFLLTIAFIDSKRPFTKKVLMRINFAELLEKISFNQVLDFYKNNLESVFKHSFNKRDFSIYKSLFLKP